jgi:hypothetical protein
VVAFYPGPYPRSCAKWTLCGSPTTRWMLSCAGSGRDGRDGSATKGRTRQRRALWGPLRSRPVLPNGGSEKHASKFLGALRLVPSTLPKVRAVLAMRLSSSSTLFGAHGFGPAGLGPQGATQRARWGPWETNRQIESNPQVPIMGWRALRFDSNSTWNDGTVPNVPLVQTGRLRLSPRRSLRLRCARARAAALG